MKNHLATDVIEIGQIWVAHRENGRVLRRIRILAKYPPPDANSYWIYETVTTYQKLDLVIGELGKIPEYNLRYVFTLEQG